MNANPKISQPRILLVGLPYGLPDTDREEFYTDKHFLDYDIVILDPQGALKGLNHDYVPRLHAGILSLDDREGPAFLDRYTGITRKLVNFVNKGGLALVFLRSMPTLTFPGQYGERVKTDLNAFLPWDEDSVHKVHGSNIEFFAKGPIGRFWSATMRLWHYEAVFDSPPKWAKLAHVKTHPDEIVAALIMTEGRGFVIMTPVLANLERLDAMPKSPKVSTPFLWAIRGLYNDLRAEGAPPQLPDWASDYHLPGETALREEIAAAQAQIEALQEQVRLRTESLDSLSLHKLLVAGHDAVLEGAVDRVLTELGMHVEPGPNSKRVDRIATYGDRKFAIEVQGVKRGAKEDHARSLTIWVQELAQQDGKEPKGLLVVNPYRDTPLAERVGKKFWSDETIKICERQGHCAMTGQQLLGLYFDAVSDDAKREQLIERMLRTEGLFKGYEDWSQFLAAAESKASENS